MKLLRLLTILLLQIVNTNAQIIDGLYSDSTQGLFFYKNGDTIGIRLAMRSAITCYGIYWGNFTIKNDKLILNNNIPKKNVSTIKLDSIQNDKILILVDSSSFPSLVITKKGKTKFQIIGNSEGVIEISKEQFEKMNINNQTVELSISTLFVNYKFKTQLELFRKYTFSSILNKSKNYKLINLSKLNFTIKNNYLVLSGNEFYDLRLDYRVNKVLHFEEFLMMN